MDKIPKSSVKPWRVFPESPDEEIVISGMSGRFPNSDSVDELAHHLYNKIDMTTEEELRWKHHLNPELPKRACLLKNLNKFDHTFFGTHAKLADVMDPQGRILLECAYEAIVDAGIHPTAMRESNTGVFMAICYSESEYLQMCGNKVKTTFGLIGNSKAMLANRLSYNLNLNGPSFSVDSACSSSMVALDMALNSIRSGECDSALVCGANLLLHPYTTLNFVRLGVLTHSGICRPFDESADGYIRSEAVGVLLLQKIKDAKRSYAKLLYVQTNCDGYKENGITFPSWKIQQKLMAECYLCLKIDPLEVDYVEAHATGTRVGDPEECITLDHIFCENRKAPLLIGSVKSSLGHSEASASLVSIIKVLLAYQSGMVSPNIHLTELRKDIPALIEGRLKVCTEVTPLPGPLVAVNSFGFGGVNGHALFRNSDTAKPRPMNADMPYLITWEGRTTEAIQEAFNKLSSRPVDPEFVALLHNLQHHENIGNDHRGYALLQSNKFDENAVNLVQSVDAYDGQKRPIIWVFAGMGSQWVGMGTALMKINHFRKTIERCQEILKPHDIDLISVITSTDKNTFNHIINSFVGIAAIQIALVNMLRALQIPFDYCIGHSVGELGCAYADGTFTEEQMLLAAYFRGLVSVQTPVIAGSMAAVGLSYEQVKKILPPSITVACHNSPNSATISGPKADVAKFVEEITAKKIFAREVPCSNIAYHSSYIAEMGPKLLEQMRELIPNPIKRSTKWLSTSVPKYDWLKESNQFSSPEYHTNNLLSPVLFEETSAFLPKNAIAIEVSPHGLMQAIVKKAVPTAFNVPLTNRTSENNLNFFLSALGKLYMNGVTMHIDRLYPAVKFPVSSRTASISPLIKWNHSQDWYVSEFSTDNVAITSERIVTVNIDSDEMKFMMGHIIDGRVLLPATCYLQMVKDSLLNVQNSSESSGIEFENVKFLRATTLTSEDKLLNVVIQFGDGRFEIREGTTAVVTGTARVLENPPPVQQLPDTTDPNSIVLQSQDFYKELRLRGYHYDGIFKSVQEARSDGTAAKIQWVDNNWPAFMDCLLQVNILAIDSRGLFLPTRIRKIRINMKHHLDMVANLDPDNAVIDVRMCKHLDTVVGGGIEVTGLSVSSVNRRKPTGMELWESYVFVPFNAGANCYSMEDAVRVCSQFILENIFKQKMKIVEIDDGREDSNYLVSVFNDVFSQIPLVEADVKIRTNRKIPDMDGLIDGDTKTSCNVIVARNCLSRVEAIEQLSKSLCDDGFLVSREPTTTSWGEIKVPVGFNLIYLIRTESETLVMMQRVYEKYKKPVVIEISSADTSYQWLAPLQEAVKEGPVVVVSQEDRYSGVLGLVNCIRREPGCDGVRCVFLMDNSAPKFSMESATYSQHMRLNIAINVYRDFAWGTYRHLTLKPNVEKVPRNSLCVAKFLRLGDLSSAVWQTGTLNKNDSNSVDVHYSSINFKDVMMATGRLSVQLENRLKSVQIGFEYSGVNANGERVMGMVDEGGMATKVRPREYLTWKVPKEFTLREAATIPVVYTTVYYAFFTGRKIAKGNSILIHAGSGAVGLAAIRVAFAYDLEVFTTVSNAEKKKFIMDLFPKLKESNIGNSRDTSFEQMVMTRTEGKGVDFVLNSLAEEKLLASVRCLGRGGTFLEIGKFDIMNNSDLGMAIFEKEITFRAVFADNLIHFIDKAKEVSHIVEADLKNGTIQPLNSTVFKADEIEKAFRYLSTGKHIGKVLLQIRDTEKSKESVPLEVCKRVEFDADMVYLVAGGLGGFGLELADWLVLRGVRKLVLSSRRGITNSYQEFRKRVWESYGCEVFVDNNDITTNSGCRQLLVNALSHGQIGGVFNLAMVIQDGILENQAISKFRECIAPKAIATRYMDELTRFLCPQLQYFVVFSSASCGRGNAGQSNYGMANSVMERIVEQRVKDGLPGKAIQWGAIGEVGFVAEMTQNRVDLEVAGILQQRIASCLNAMDDLLMNSEPIVSSMVVAQKKRHSHLSALGNILNVMGLSDIKNVSQKLTLNELGMDSLMAVEIKQILEREYDVNLTPTDIRSLTFGKLKELADSKGKDSSAEDEGVDTKDVADEFILLYKDFKDEETEGETVMNLNSSFGDGVADRSLLIPGLEGVVVGGFNELGMGINMESFGLNVQKFGHIEQFEELTSTVLKDVISTFKGKKSFTLIAHSFGSNIALQLSKELESTGLTGRILLIDGYPRMIKQMAISSFNDNEITPEATLFVVMQKFLSLVCPEVSPETLFQTVKTYKTLEEKITAFSSLLPKRLPRSEKWLYNLIMGMYNRVNMALNTPDTFEEKIESPITLVRPLAGATDVSEEEKLLAEYTKGQVDVVFIEGNHFTMLEKGNLIKYINEVYLTK